MTVPKLAAQSAKRLCSLVIAASGLLILMLFPSSGSAQATWSANGTNVYYNNGNVGIGTSTPATSLEVTGPITAPSVGSSGDTFRVKGVYGGDEKGFRFIWSPSWVDITGIGGVDLLNWDTHFKIADDKQFVFGMSNDYSMEYSSTQNLWKLFVIGHNNNPDIDAIAVNSSGNVGIGTTSPQYKLAVNGTVGAKEVMVTATGWPDYVFNSHYQLRPLNEVKDYIQEHHTLPGIPSEKEVQETGVGLGEMQRKLLEKVEELTLHLIAVNDENARLKSEQSALLERVSQLESR
jgi:hypothetical protein